MGLEAKIHISKEKKLPYYCLSVNAYRVLRIPDYLRIKYGVVGKCLLEIGGSLAGEFFIECCL